MRCYVTCPGTEDGDVDAASDTKNILRFTPSQRGGRTTNQVLAERTFQQFGAELVRFCHFGTESSIIERLFEKLQSFRMDLRPVLGNAPIYDSKKHLEKLGMQRDLSGLCQRTHDRPDSFIKVCVWKSGGGAIGSEGAGVNMWALLTAASMVGCDHIHCKASSRFAQNALRLILKSAPASATPGNVIPLRSFHEVSKEVEYVAPTGELRPENYLRPIDDSNFAINGVFTYCPVVDGEMPEDYLGVGYVREMAKFLKCKYYEVPPQHMYGHYQLMPGRYHCIYNNEKQRFGSILISDDGVTVEFDLIESEQWEFDIWEEKLRQERYLVLPTIWRCGALVSLDDGDVGCLVPNGTRVSMESQGQDPDAVGFVSNFDHIQLCYHALLDEDGETKSIGVLQTLEKLIPPGTFLWIKPETSAWEALSDRFPASTLSEEERALRVVRVRLNVPLTVDPAPGKVHVTVLQRDESSPHSLDFTFSHLQVDPWELTTEVPEDERLEIKELVG